MRELVCCTVSLSLSLSPPPQYRFVRIAPVVIAILRRREGKNAKFCYPCLPAPPSPLFVMSTPPSSFPSPPQVGHGNEFLTRAKEEGRPNEVVSHVEKSYTHTVHITRSPSLPPASCNEVLNFLKSWYVGNVNVVLLQLSCT